VLVPYAVQDMFDLVEQAEHYPQFVPWCVGATILERSDEWVSARIEFSYLKFRFGFQTRNPKQRPQLLQVRLVEGPFKHLQVDWTFTALGDQGCRVNFFMSYEIADRMLDSLAAPAVGLVSKSMMDAFVKRAQATLKEIAPSQGPAAATVHAVALPTVAPQDPTGDPTMNPTDPRVSETLRGSRLAQDLTPEQAVVLAGVLRLESLPAKAVLAREGSADNRLYVITSGTLAVVKGVGTAEEAVLSTLNVGDFAHELGFLDGAERYASLVAQTDLQLLVLEREGLESLLDSHPRVVYGVMRTIVRTVHRTQSRMSLQATELTNYIVKQHGRY
jgi:ribosome-associated toxin RatA of RatAB toxin-antitoxin module/CRP-like cAMP-binding protein